MSKSWQSKVIGEFSKLTAGGTPSTKNKEFWSNGSIPWLSSGEVHKKRIHFADNFITEEGLKNSSAKIIPKKTLLVALAGQGKTRGTVAITEIETTTNQSIAGIITRADICDPDYLFFNLDSRYDELRAISGGSGRAGLNLEILSNVEVALPPHPQQKKIASILTSVDEVIENTQKQINKLQNLKKATMNDLLTKGIGHAEFRDSELGRIPKTWEVKPIREFVQDYKGGAALTPSDFTDFGFPVIPKKSVQFGGKIILGINRTFCQKKFAEANETHVVNQQYIIATLRDLVPSGPTIGLMGVLDQDERFMLAQGVYGFRMNERLSKSFLSYLSNTEWYRVIMRRLMVGSTQVHIRTGEFLDTKIPVPSISEQLEISSMIDAYEDLIKSKVNKLDKYTTLKKSLMHGLLAGKNRVEVK